MEGPFDGNTDRTMPTAKHKGRVSRRPPALETAIEKMRPRRGDRDRCHYSCFITSTEASKRLKREPAFFGGR